MSKPIVKIAAKPAMSPTGKRSKPSTPKPLVAKSAKPAKPNIAPAKATSKPKQGVERKTLHPRNLHAHGYDFSALMTSYPKLKTFVRPTPYGALSIDFADPLAVKTLNAALLKHH